MYYTKVVEKMSTHFFNSLSSENCIVCEIMSKNLVQSEGPQMMPKHGAHALQAA
jgi:hypothetical protein